MGSIPFNPDQKVVKTAEIVETRQLKTGLKKSMVPLSLIMNGFLSKKKLKGLSGKRTVAFVESRVIETIFSACTLFYEKV